MIAENKHTSAVPFFDVRRCGGGSDCWYGFEFGTAIRTETKRPATRRKSGFPFRTPAKG